MGRPGTDDPIVALLFAVALIVGPPRILAVKKIDRFVNVVDSLRPAELNERDHDRHVDGDAKILTFFVSQVIVIKEVPQPFLPSSQVGCQPWCGAEVFGASRICRPPPSQPVRAVAFPTSIR